MRRQLESTEECLGRTIERIEEDHWYDCTFVLFTDDSFLSLSSGFEGGPPGVSTRNFGAPSSSSDVTNYLKLGLMSTEEGAPLLARFKHEEATKREANERADYERLKTKFG